MDRTFIRQAWYVKPPCKGASKEEWDRWLKADAKAARQAEARFNRAHKRVQPIEQTFESPVVAIDGVYKQVPFIGSK